MFFLYIYFKIKFNIKLYFKRTILLVNRYTLKIGDLTITDSEKYKNSLACYKSPELHYFNYDTSINVNNKTDIWSIGIILFELIKLDIPFKNLKEVLNNDIPDIGEHDHLGINVLDHFKNMLKMYIKYNLNF